MDAGADDVRGNTAAREQFAAAAELDHSLTHGFTALGDGLNLEIIQLIMAAGDTFNRKECCVNGAVADADTFQAGIALIQLQVCGGGNGITR